LDLFAEFELNVCESHDWTMLLCVPTWVQGAFRMGVISLTAGHFGVVRKTPLFEPFLSKRDHFTKTGSGQT
jgi:hypothetical protein